MNEQSMKFRLGVFAIGTAILLAILIILFGEFPTFWSRPLEYTITLPAAPGVEQGTPVRKSGVRIGEVTGVDLDPNTNDVQVKILVQRKYQLRQNDEVILGRGLLGDSSVNFEPDLKVMGEMAQGGHTFVGKLPGDLRQMLGKATDLVPTAQASLEEIRIAAANLNKMMPEIRRSNDELRVALTNVSKAAEGLDNMIRGNQDRVTKAIDRLAELAGRVADLITEENKQHVNVTIKNFRSASDKLDTLMKNVETTSKSIDATVKDFDVVARNADMFVADARRALKTTETHIDKIGKNADGFVTDGRATLQRFQQTLDKGDAAITDIRQSTKIFSERTPAIMKNLDEGTARFNQITMNVADFAKALAQGDGTLRRLVADPTLYNSMNDAAAGLNKAMIRLDRIMADIALFADKVARHPEVLGVGGAVSPSSGIKR